MNTQFTSPSPSATPPASCLLLCGLVSALHATETWTPHDTPSNLDLHGITVARLETPDGPRSSFFIAGQGGLWRGDQPLTAEWELVMTDPGTWSGIATKAAAGAFSSVEAVGHAGVVARSFDGDTWTSSINPDAGNFTAVAANDQLVVAVDDLGQIFAGNNVTTLSARHTEPNVSWTAVAFGNGVWVVVGNAATVATSNDGLNWQVQQGALTDGLPAVDFHDVTFGPASYQGGFFLAVGEEGFICTSDTGIDWTTRQSARGPDRRLRAATFAARHAAWITMGDGGIGNVSHNAAVSFSNISHAFPQGINDLAYGLGFTVAVGNDGRVFSSVTRLNPASNALNAPPSGQINVPSTGGTFPINLNSSSSQARWKADILGTSRCPDPAAFISVAPESGTGNNPASFTITVDPFNTVDNRCGIVLLNDLQIPIVQAGDGDPQPVSALTADPLTDTAIQLTWPPAIGATHYELFRRHSSNVQFHSIARITGAANATGTLEYVDRAGLLPNTTYCYQVVALNMIEETQPRFPAGVICNQGCSGSGTTTFLIEFGRAQEPSPESCATTLLTGAEGFFGEIIAFEAIKLHWNPVPGASSYVLERDSGSGFALVAAPSENDSSFLDTTIPNLDYFQSHSYRLTASGGVPQTTTVRTTVQPPTAFVVAVDIPDVPLPGGSALEGAFDVSWSRRDFLNTEIQTRVEPAGNWISIDPSTSLVSRTDSSVNGGIRTETWRHTQPHVIRSYRARTRGNLGTPNPPSEWIVCGPVSTPAPPDPTSFSLLSRASTSASFAWSELSNAHGFELTLRPANAIDDSQDIVVLESASPTGAYVTGLFPGTSYDAFLVAVGVEGENAISRSIMGAHSATLTFNTLPRPPSTVTATANGPEFVAVGWSQVIDATSYEVWRREFISPLGWTDYELFTTTGSGSLSTSDFTVEGGHSYQYQVRARIETDATDFKESTTVSTPLGAPSLISASPLTASSIALDWSDSNNVVLGYIVERATNNNGPWDPVQSLFNLFAPVPTESINSGLSPDTTYFYRIKAFSLFDNVSQPSNVQSATTLSRLTVADQSSSSITLNWEPVNDALEYHFELSKTGDSGPFGHIGSAPPDVEKFTHEDLDPSSILHYRMRPVFKSNSFGPYTEVSQAVTTPLPPRNLTAELTLTPTPQVNLKWNQGSTSDRYFVQWRPTGSSFVTIATNNASTLSFTHATPLPGQNDYRVRAAFVESSSTFTTISSVNWNLTAVQQWRFDHFGTTANEGTAADDADPDGDTAPNAHERAAGTNPHDDNDFLGITRVEVDPPNIHFFWNGAANVTYDVSQSTNLTDFTAIPTLRRTSTGRDETASVSLSSPSSLFRIDVVPPIEIDD